MHECDASPAGPTSGRLVDEAVPRGAAARERAVEIRDPVAHMMNAGTALGDELRDGTRGIERLEQLDVHGPERQGDDGRAVGALRSSGSQAEDVAIEAERSVDTGHRDA